MEIVKVTTEDLKKAFSGWLGTDELKEEIRNFYLDEDATEEDAEDIAEEYKLPKGLGLEGTRDAIFAMWKDGEQWKRVEKKRLGDDADQYFMGDGEFWKDFAGQHSPAALAKIEEQDDEEVRGRCFRRVFAPANELKDTFRLEVITNPDDTEIVGWNVITD